MNLSDPKDVHYLYKRNFGDIETVHNSEAFINYEQDVNVNTNTCPRCGGDADNGHDRCYPQNPYHCQRCVELSDSHALRTFNIRDFKTIEQLKEDLTTQREQAEEHPNLVVFNLCNILANILAYVENHENGYGPNSSSKD